MSESTLLARKRASLNSPDDFQTPGWAVEPLFRVISRWYTVWDPACGRGNLVRAFTEAGYYTLGTDILNGPDQDFFRVGRDDAVGTVLVTNPPYSLKDRFLAHCYALGRPFALLLPITALEGQVRQSLYRKHGVELILLPRRVNFETPNGEGSSAWFPVAWFCWRLHLPSPLWFWSPQPVLFKPKSEGK